MPALRIRLAAVVLCVVNLVLARGAAADTRICIGDCVWPDVSNCSGEECICTFNNACADPSDVSDDSW